MAQVEFHSGVAAPLHFACRLLRKAWRSGARVVVTGEAAMLAEVDRLLWTFEPLEFEPHWRGAGVDAVPERLRETPVLLLEQHSPALGHDVLVNLGHEVPPDWQRYRRVIEVVSRDEFDRDRARARWRHYGAAGATIEKHEAGGA